MKKKKTLSTFLFTVLLSGGLYNCIAQNPYENNFPSFATYWTEHGVNLTQPATGWYDMDKFNVITRTDKRPQSERRGSVLLSGFLLSEALDYLVGFQATDLYREGHLVHSGLSRVIAEIESNEGLPRKGWHDMNQVDISPYLSTFTGDVANLFNADTVYVYQFPNGKDISLMNNTLDRIKEKGYHNVYGVVLVRTGCPAFDVKLFSWGKMTHEDVIEAINGLVVFNNRINEVIIK